MKATKLDRNNTDFPIELFEALKKLQVGTHPKYGFLKYWQDLCRLYVTELDVGTRGLLIQHPMGFGKSILAVALSIEFLDQGRVMLILAKSLQGNMRDQIKKYVRLRGKHDEEFAPGKFNDADLDAWITEHFAFVSLNAGNMMGQVATKVEFQGELDTVLESRLGRIVGDKGSPNLNGMTIIVDEAHHLFRMISNGSKNGLAFYDAVKGSTCNLFFLTGTPVASDPFEVVPCFNMLSGLPYPLFPETYEEFNRLFVDDKTKQLINKGKYQNRIMGMVTSISIDDEIGIGLNPNLTDVAADLRERIPVEYPCIVRKVHMSQEQYVIYQLAREKEAEESKKTSGDRGFGFKNTADAPRQPSARMTKPKSFAASTYKVKSRQYSNFCPVHQLKEKDPAAIADITSSKFDAMYKDMTLHVGQLGLVYSQFIGVGGLGIFAKYLESKGWTAENNLVSLVEEEATAGVDVSQPGDHVGSAINDVDVSADVLTDKAAEVAGGSDYSFDVDDLGDVNCADNVGDIARGGTITIEDYMGYLDDMDPWVTKSPSSFAGGDPSGNSEVAHRANSRKCSCGDPQCKCECSCVDKCHCGWRQDNPTYRSGCECGCPDPNCQCKCRGKTPCVCSVDCTCHCKPTSRGGDQNPLFRDGAGTGASVYSRKFAILTGAVKVEERERIIAKFVSKENSHGELIAVLLVSATGAEGLDLKCLRFIMMMEPYWVWNRFAQLFARGPRIDSHNHLPPEERNCQPYLYLAIPPESERSTIDGKTFYVSTTDTELYSEALINKESVTSFINANREVSIECMANGGQCRVCAPTGATLFTDDPDADVKRADPCMKYHSVEIKAQEIVLDGIKYHYTVGTGVLKYDVFVFDEKLGSHKKLPENSPEFEAVVRQIDPSLFDSTDDLLQ